MREQIRLGARAVITIKSPKGLDERLVLGLKWLGFELGPGLSRGCGSLLIKCLYPI